MSLVVKEIAGLVLRITVGAFWLYFGSQKWLSYEWVHPLMETAASSNPLPVYGLLLRNIILPNWRIVAIVQTWAETLVGAALVLGFATRLCASVGVFMAVNLGLTFIFYPSTELILVFWFYVLSVVANLALFLDSSSRKFGIDRFVWKRWPGYRL